MKRVILPILLIIGMLYHSCRKEFNLSSDQTIVDTFNSTEIGELSRIVSYVDSFVLKTTKSSDINIAYRHFFQHYYKVLIDSSQLPSAPIPEDEKYRFINGLDKQFFETIWHMELIQNAVRYEDSMYYNLEIKNLAFSPKGNFAMYLKEIGQNDKYFNQMNTLYEVLGGLPPSSLSYILTNNNEFDFNISKNRLWAAILLLSLEDHFDLKMQRYLSH